MTSRKQAKSGGSRNSQLVRILRVLRDLDVLGGVDLYELAQRHGTTTRTMRRDLEALQEAGIPLSEEPDGKRKRWSVSPGDRLTQRLSGLVDMSHYLALRMAMGEGAVTQRASGIFASLEDLSGKIEKALGPQEHERLAAIDACFLSREQFAYRRSPPEVFWPLIDAIGEGRICRVKYRAPKVPPKETEFRLLPLRIFAHDGAPYVLGWVPRFKTVITLNLQRLVSLSPTKETSPPPPAFDAERWQNATFGIFGGGLMAHYHLRFDAEVAPYIRERVWHPSQQTKELKGGAVELEFTCFASYEVTAWVASWRQLVEVLAPENLKVELGKVGEWMAGKYGSRKTGERAAG